jgi:GNAT superfamily N-acetyltransferase
MVTIVWDLTQHLPKRLVNKRIVLRPALEEQLEEVGRILVVTWGGFIENPEVTRNRVGPFLSAGLEQPFIAYLWNKPVGCVSPRLDNESKVGVLDGGVHVLSEYRRQYIGTALLLTALEWLRDHKMKAAKVTPFNPEGEDAVKRAIAFYLANGGRIAKG